MKIITVIKIWKNKNPEINKFPILFNSKFADIKKVIHSCTDYQY